MRSVWSIVVLAGVLAFAAGCDKLPFGSRPKGKTEGAAPKLAVKGTLVARVNNIPITLDDLNDEINAYNAMVGDRTDMKITTRDQKIAHLKNELVRRALLYQYAMDKGLDRNDDVNRVLEKTKMDLLVLELMRQETQKIDVSSQEVQDAYNTYKDQFKEPEERRLREIMVPTEDEAKDVLIQSLQGADFAQLARDRSKLPTAKDGGDTGFITKGKRSPQYDAVAFADSLEEGKVSSVFKGPDGF